MELIINFIKAWTVKTFAIQCDIFGCFHLNTEREMTTKQWLLYIKTW